MTSKFDSMKKIKNISLINSKKFKILQFGKSLKLSKPLHFEPWRLRLIIYPRPSDCIKKISNTPYKSREWDAIVFWLKFALIHFPKILNIWAMMLKIKNLPHGPKRLLTSKITQIKSSKFFIRSRNLLMNLLLWKILSRSSNHGNC